MQVACSTLDADEKGRVVLLVMIGVALALLVLLWWPFFLAGETRLVACAAINDRVKLDALRRGIIARYLADEDAWRAGQLRAGVWRKRQIFLTSRYIDVCRRLDYLAAVNDAR